MFKPVSLQSLWTVIQVRYNVVLHWDDNHHADPARGDGQAEAQTGDHLRAGPGLGQTISGEDLLPPVLHQRMERNVRYTGQNCLLLLCWSDGRLLGWLWLVGILS